MDKYVTTYIWLGLRMNELNLYKFLEDISIDWRSEKLIAWIPFYRIQDFVEMIGYDYFSESGHDVNLQYESIALDLVPICEYFDIEPERILEKIE